MINADSRFSLAAWLNEGTEKKLLKAIREGNVGIARKALQSIPYPEISGTRGKTYIADVQDEVKELTAILYYISVQAGLDRDSALDIAQGYIRETRNKSSVKDLYRMISSEVLHYTKKIGEIIPGDHYSDLVKNALAYIQDHFREEISTDIIAKQFGTSVPNLCRAIRSQTGITVTILVNRLRVNYAAGLLRQTSLKISEISSKSGFHQVTYFERAFQHIMGMTPREYRKSLNR